MTSCSCGKLGLIRSRGSAMPLSLCGRSTRLLFHPSFLRSAVRFRCILDGNVIDAAAAAAGSCGAAHAGVTSALAHLAVTAVAIASGACLSTKVDFLWPRAEDQPDSLVIDGVDLTPYSIFKDTEVQKAIEFARKAHYGQYRKSGESYVTHCIHTGRILSALVPANGKKAVNTVIAGILHDVIDDTSADLNGIENEFGEDVARLVAGVSKLSYINQLLRRHRQKSANGSTLSPEEANNLGVMLLGMVDDSRVVLIKLADRLHNMRTIFALSMPKAQAVAQETLTVWCSLASRLGAWALKAEMEDLCFAVLQPHIFRKMRAELAFMWNPSNRARNLRRLSSRAGFQEPDADDNIICSLDLPLSTYDNTDDMRDLLQAVLPFDLLLDRKKRTNFVNNHRKCTEPVVTMPKVVRDATIALESLTVCEEALELELLISTSYIPGMEVKLSSRLKSLYSIYCKMKRKNVDIGQVYDARALRVVVGDSNGCLHGPAVKCCYSLLNTVHRLWTPIHGEFDDYIVNPKPSGYQSLHTAVHGPDSSPIEVQIRTQRMHNYAESGHAAHWLYKENKVENSSTIHDSRIQATSCQTTCVVDEGYIQDNAHHKHGSLKVGHPVLRIEGSQLLTAVVIRVDNGGRGLLVAVRFGLEASEALAERRSTFQIKRWEAYARLYKKVSDQWWFAPGHGDWCTCLEKYTLCRDGMFHKEDQFCRLLPTFIQVIDMTEDMEAEYWNVVAAVFEGKQVIPVPSSSSYSAKSSLESTTSPTADDGINNKVNLLRTMLRWEEQVRHGATIGEGRQGSSTFGRYRSPSSVVLREVVIITWPHGELMRVRSGSTAADAARRLGADGKLVLVNGQLVLPHTELKDGDILEVRM